VGGRAGGEPLLPALDFERSDLAAIHDYMRAHAAAAAAVAAAPAVSLLPGSGQRDIKSEGESEESKGQSFGAVTSAWCVR
jgi:hypothetical protein